MKITAKLWIGIAVLIILSPLGLVLPQYFKAGGAWGELKLSSLWNAWIPDYTFKGWEEKGLSHLSLSYIASAFVGVAVTILAVLFIGKKLTKKDD